jgi:hypothetical protein
MRNVGIMQEVLSGKDYGECAKKFNISVASVANSIRFTLKLLREHTDIDVLESSNYGYVLEMKAEIKKYLTEPFPKTTITPSAREYLQEQFGKYYASTPSKVAAAWMDITKAFNHFRAQRDLLSIQRWLASEGHLVGNVLTDTMLNFAWEALKEGLSSVKADQGEYSFAIKKVERTGWKTKLVVHAEIKQKDHQVVRRFLIDLIPG